MSGYLAGFCAAQLRLLPVCAVLLLAACHPAAPPETAPPATSPPAATRAASAALAAPVAPALAPDAAAPPVATLRLPGGQTAELRPATEAAFAQLDSTRSVPGAGLDTDPADQPLPERVRRVGNRLLLSPQAGPVVALRSDTAARPAGSARPPPLPVLGQPAGGAPVGGAAHRGR